MARSKAKAAPQMWESYLFEVAPANPSYSLSLAVPKYDPGLYSEHWHFELAGKCIAPLKLAGRDTRLLFLADRNYFERPRSADPNWKPLGVGHLSMRGAHSEYLCSIPFDAAWGVATAIATGLFRYLHLDGSVLKRGSAQIRYMAFQATYERRDYFDDPEETPV
jgi:hypothetical protein